MLEHYYTDFPIYNPYLERMHDYDGGHGNGGRRKGAGGNYSKYYEMDPSFGMSEKVSKMG